MTLNDAIDSLNQHRDHGRPCGGFLTSVLENNLMGAVGHADETSLQHLPAIVHHVAFALPLQSWGSPAKVAAWRERKLQDREATA